MKNISLNFGSIKDTIFRYSSKTIINEGKTSSFVDLFVEELKKKPILKLQYLIYKNIENANFKKEYLAERYLNQNINLIKDYNWNDILKENKDFRVDILKNFHVESSPEKGYSHLNESEQNLVKILMSEENYKVNYLEDLKQENLTLINTFLTNAVDSETANNLNKFKNKIENLTNSNLDESIINLYELNLNLKD